MASNKYSLGIKYLLGVPLTASTYLLTLSEGTMEQTETRHPYAQLHANGSIWHAGKDVWGLCAAWNHATNPARLMTDAEHLRASAYARAIKNRMARLGIRCGSHYRELSNGSLWPLKVR